MYMTNGRHMECPGFTADVQDTSALRKMSRTPRTDQAETRNYLSVIEINFPTPSPKPSVKLRKTLIST